MSISAGLTARSLTGGALSVCARGRGAETGLEEGGVVEGRGCVAVLGSAVRKAIRSIVLAGVEGKSAV